ncbi:hypothetical protein CERSUDRAFT_116096 [Gelatoporia subvermispora B]|uniref:protein-tyrosine-phosphatase n=1 Tax=Ceriporiopsis subvermispora (strain B) TaxID=914234 RepID=M2PGY3_CERS8|nr:hypothetical protein CERSUDRAFT_116096 [Gelatoporia subvermispora B]
MDEVLPNLWIGDLPSALNTEKLRAHNIRSVVTAMRGRTSIHETFSKLQLNIDDTEDTDVLPHLVSAITFIQAELDKQWGVLVHCQAGMSRSATIVAAYLMYSQDLDVEGALEMIRKVRPSIQPNDGFLRQLEVFHAASFNVSRKDKATRMYYLERVVQDVMNGDGSVETNMFAKYPRTPSDSVPATPLHLPKRRIRCKMCRQELATREHMLDHGQLGPATPASAYALSPAPSRRPSMHENHPLNPLRSQPPSRRPSTHERPLGPLTPLTSSSTPSRRPSATESGGRPRMGSATDTRPLKSSLLALDSAAHFGQAVSDLSDTLSESALEEEEEEEEPPSPKVPTQSAEEQNGQAVSRETHGEQTRPALPLAKSEPASAIPPLLARRLSSSSGGLAHPSDLAAQLYANPKLAALRSPGVPGMSPLTPLSPMSPAGPGTNPQAAKIAAMSPPILVNPKCSGYFVEPMKWMEPFLEEGQIAGKIACPNKKCGAKLGNYDWAGVCCGCKEWVVPGFCINRSKVDEVV